LEWAEIQPAIGLSSFISALSTSLGGNRQF
jgi:hypothetical protein